jgi:pimeloyl-ACP methyl ester carboxylesterase
VLLLGCWLLAPATPSRGDLIFLKDGFVLQGKIRREGKTVVEGGEAVWLPQGFFLIDDSARRIIFSHTQVQEVSDTPVPVEADIRTGRTIVYPPGTKPLPFLRDFTETGEWNGKWERDVKAKTANGEFKVITHLTYLSPHYARVDSTRSYAWSGHYLTRELGPETVKRLLSLYPDLQEVSTKTEEDNATRRFRVFQFFVNAGWYDQADDELENIRKRMPGQSDKVAAARAGLKKLKAQRLFDDIRTANSAGRHEWAQKQLDKFPQEGIDEKLLTQVRSLKDRYESANDSMKLARRFLRELPPKIESASDRPLFSEAARAIDAELHLDLFLKNKSTEADAGRLDAFLQFAQQAERQRAQDKKEEHSPSELLALAVSGWLMGNASAETKVEQARKLWQARRFVLQFQRTHLPGDRQDLLESYAKVRSDALDPLEMAQLIPFLPPAEPEGTISTARVEMKTGLPWTKEIAYQLQLPPEYHHGRAYPVLLVLHKGDERARQMLSRWSALAGEQGYILVAPEWEANVNGIYTYSTREHAAVLDVLRDLRRRFHVDSDRVFLAGCGQGGNMAFDVGLSHPDQFAGVLPMSAIPGPFALNYYWRNAQYLPFYVVGGDWTGDPRKYIRGQFDKWVPRGYPAMYVEYKGRGLEWFDAEVSFSFDWMGRKKRANPLTELGSNPGAGPFGQEFQTMRTTDNRFYWLSTDAIADRHLNDARRWDARTMSAMMQAKIGANNQINVYTFGLKQLTIWFARGMIDFDKPVTVTGAGLRVLWNNQKVVPKLSTLLEDYYQRADQQRLYVAKVELDKL